MFVVNGHLGLAVSLICRSFVVIKAAVSFCPVGREVVCPVGREFAYPGGREVACNVHVRREVVCPVGREVACHVHVHARGEMACHVHVGHVGIVDLDVSKRVDHHRLNFSILTNKYLFKES
jgi:hypothetical protein